MRARRLRGSTREILCLVYNIPIECRYKDSPSHSAQRPTVRVSGQRIIESEPPCAPSAVPAPRTYLPPECVKNNPTRMPCKPMSRPINVLREAHQHANPYGASPRGDFGGL
ncbi:hypothetical protein BV20DRAFT_338056 [Pilatotrama ljubarskyi]|nr:hypothetical protein BV20DRAFT_338056 [Pilatotrama ljubarskyi]